MLEFDDTPDTGQPKIKVVGVGGGGGNSINTMIAAGVQGVDFLAINTDCQVLGANQASIKVQIGKGLTKGLGAGAHPEVGAAAALEDRERLAEILSGADMVFVTAGMGGGTGTGAAPVVAEIAREIGALTVGVVTKPFNFEGLQRKKRAAAGIALLSKSVDALIVIPNDRLLGVAGQKTSLQDAFALVDAVCLNAVRGISDLVMVPGLINVDFADVRTIMTGTGRALMGTGRAKGENRAIDAAKMSINSPLLEDVTINGATGILVNITGGPDLTLAEVNEACSLVQEAADPECNIIFGSVIDPNCGDEVRITVIATGFQPTASAAELGSGGSMGGRRGNQQMALPMSRQSGASGAPPVRMTQPVMPPAVVLQPPHHARANAETSGATPAHMNQGDATDTSPYVLRYESPRPPAGSPEDDSYARRPSDVHADMHAVAGDEFDDGSGGGDLPVAQAQPPQYQDAWSPSGERPIIRPPVKTPMSMAAQGSSQNTVTGWPPGYAPSMMEHEDLGIEDSEYDKPTFMRRRAATRENTPQPHAGAPSGRYPGERE